MCTCTSLKSPTPILMGKLVAVLFVWLTLACWGGLTCLEDGVLRNESYTMWCNTAEQIWIMGQWTMRSSQGWGHKSRGAVVQHSISYQWRKLQQGSDMQHCLRAWFNVAKKGVGRLASAAIQWKEISVCSAVTLFFGLLFIQIKNSYYLSGGLQGSPQNFKLCLHFLMFLLSCF